MKKNLRIHQDAVVVGAGHAGCEAALALARLGFQTTIFTVSVDSIALMPCNPNIGGSSKGHLVKEIDALGGEMGKNIDATYIQSKMLNKSKGPAVHSLRAQADKKAYSDLMRSKLEENKNITIKQGEVTELIVENKKIKGVKTFTGAVYECQVCILCTGTYLKAKCITGEVSTYTGPNGLMAANYLSESLEKNGLKIRSFKTGTPARIDGNTVDYEKMEPQFGDETVVPFSFTNKPEDIQKEQVKCWLTYTNENTHEIIRNNLDRSPLFSGIIKGTGPRYCPSIEDKVVRFSDKNRHQIFIEPEGLYTSEVYIGGMSSSLPEDVQYEMYHTVPGLEHARIVRNAYAIEYDCIDSLECKASLECKKIDGLYSAGQANGSSGYEEAAAQGLLAGINAARKLQGKEPVILDRSQAYIGVLIDDLVTKGTNEPYRMMTSRAEYRLLLRQDNADLRLTPLGYEIGLIEEERYEKLLQKQKMIEKEIERIKNTSVGGTEKVQKLLEKCGSTILQSGITLAELIRRPELNYELIASIDEKRPELPNEVCEQVNINIKYEGYIDRQWKQVQQFKKLEKKKIPEQIDYTIINSLRKEAVQKLSEIRPESVGQAARISGVSPADISVLLVYLEKYNVSRETNETNIVKQIFDQYHIKLTNYQIELFETYYQLLIDWNKKINLTTITEYEEIVKKHFLDSCLLLQLYSIDTFVNKKIIDVGTGAGFPGIPLAILLPETKFILIDSLNKRIDFLSVVIEKLKLENVEIFHGRAEDFGKDHLFREQFDFCVSRAVAALPLLLEYCSPFIKTDGKLLLYKSRKIEQEISDADNALHILNCDIQQYKKLADENDFQRYILEIIKKEHTPEQYPRKAGKPKKYPL